MFKKILKVLFTVLGGFLGYIIGKFLLDLKYINSQPFLQFEYSRYAVYAVLCILFAIIFYLLSNRFTDIVSKVFKKVDSLISKVPVWDLLIGFIGGSILLLIYYLGFSRFVESLPYVGTFLSLIIKIVVFVLGVQIGASKKEELLSLMPNYRAKHSKTSKKSEVPKILDTSVIIDGRILDICRTGFIEGPLIIPSPVLEELRHIADSADGLKRNRGRRGLDILNKIQKEIDIEVRIWSKEIKDAKEVDVKLLVLARELGGKVVTNDYNLNKVAEFQGVSVLNINELANSVKPILLPGEELSILVSKAGKEHNQGIGYLDDGTMIVVENGRKFVDSTIDIVVTSVLQTAAGRMIFARPKSEQTNE